MAHPFDLFTDDKTGKLSTSKFWLNVGYGALTFALVRSPLTPEIILAYGSVVAGNNVAIYWLKRKYGNVPDPSQPPQI